MTTEEAKFILEGYRPDGAPVPDVMFGEALEQARSDPRLASWLERNVAFDRAMAAHLGGTPPPAGLREAILAGGRVSRRPSRLRRLPLWLALAAGVAFAAVLVRSRPAGTPAEGTAFAHFAIADLHAPGHKADPDPTLEAWIAANHQPLDQAAIPVDFNRMHASGCRTLSFDGHEVIELCFRQGGVWFHLYFRANGTGDRGFAPADVVDSGGVATTWSDGRYTYVLATEATLKVLKRLT